MAKDIWLLTHILKMLSETPEKREDTNRAISIQEIENVFKNSSTKQHQAWTVSQGNSVKF